MKLIGDILVSSGVIAYAGPFTMVYRNQITADWVRLCLKNEIPSSEVYNMSNVLGDAVKIRQWGLLGLPVDSFSIENCIIMKNARRWPLFIDPQGQGNKFIKNLEKVRNIMVIKPTTKKYGIKLEAAIQNGLPMMMENV